MLSVILVPICTLVLLVLLYLLLSPRRRQDSPAAAQYQIVRATEMAAKLDERPSRRDLKKLDITVSRAKGFAERARLEDVYDMTLPCDKLAEARTVTQALVLAAPADALPHLQMVKQLLSEAGAYIRAYCGDVSTTDKRMSFAMFNKKARAERARRYLDERIPQKSDTESPAVPIDAEPRR